MGIRTKNKRVFMEKLCDQRGCFKILAIDHREVYSQSLKAGLGAEPTFRQIVETKKEIISCLEPFVSGFLVDQQYCVPEITDSTPLKRKGFMIGMEGDDYSTTCFDRENYLNPQVTVEGIKKAGGSMVKLFMYYNPHSPLASAQEELIASVAQKCSQQDMPFLLEPILFFEDPSYDWQQKEELTIEMLERLKNFEVDVFKLSYPCDIINSSEAKNNTICAKISEILTVPWILLSSGCEKELFLKQLEIACANGASGFAVGRTLWTSYLHSGCNALDALQAKKMVDDLQMFCSVVDRRASDWRDRLC